MTDSDFPAGARLYREYQARLRDGASVHIAFTLGDESLESPARSVARRLGAEAFGMISLIEIATDSRYLFVWTHDDRELAIIAAEDNARVRDELKDLVGRYVCVFLADAAALAPRAGGVAPLPSIDDSARRG